jgi:hypothetical protein
MSFFGSTSSPDGAPGALLQDGSNSPTANIDWGQNKITNIAAVELDDGTDQVNLKPGKGLSGKKGIVFEFVAGEGDSYVVASAFGSSLVWQNTVAGTYAFANIIAQDDDGTDSTGFSACRRSGVAGGPVECVQVAWRDDVGTYRLDTSTFGGGSVAYPIGISAQNWTSEPAPNMTIETDGSVSIEGGNLDLTSGNVLTVASTQVVGPRVTGYADPTGTTDRATFDTTTVSTQDLAEFVKALYEDLKSHGLIGN